MAILRITNFKKKSQKPKPDRDLRKKTLDSHKNSEKQTNSIYTESVNRER